MDQYVIETKSLWHRYTRPWALRDVSLRIERGGVVGLLGSNGAGKSTLMNIVCGCLSQTKGVVQVADQDVREHPKGVRQRIGFLPQQAPLSYELTVKEFLQFSAKVRGVKKADLTNFVAEVLERCALLAMQDRLLANLSGGYRQRVGIAQAIVHRPDLVVLDEPTVGLDPNQILGVRDLIRDIGNERTVLISTHILPEVEAMCREVVMIEQGSLAFQGSLNDFRSIAKSSALIVSLTTTDNVMERLSQIVGISRIDSLSTDGKYRLIHDDDESLVSKLLEVSASEGWQLNEVYYERPPLEDVFKSLSKRGVINAQ